VQRALETLPWVRKATVDFSKKQVTVIVESKSFDAAALVNALQKAEFGGEILGADKKPGPTLPSVTLQVIGMKKTASGAT